MTTCLRLTLLTLLLLPVSSVAQPSAISPSVQLLLLDDNNSPHTSIPEFGAPPVDESSRPKRDWISAFDGVTATPLSGSLQAAIDDCDGSTLCVIEIGQLQLSGTVYLYRSNLKLIGAVDNKVTYTGTNSVFLIPSGVHNIIIEGLQIDGRINNTPSSRDPDIYGILLYGDSIDRVLIKNNHLHYLHGKDNAHGIAALGTGSSEGSAISNIIIEQNRLEDLRTGSSEAIAINGNVRNWEVTHNQISRTNNIAIDAIGGEGTSPTQTVAGRILPGRLDAARHGFIEYNQVTDMSTVTNPAYGNQHSWAAGIYIDGARDITVRHNTVQNAPWAFEVGAENCIETSNITLTDNTASDSRYGDLLIGGYASRGYLEHSDINCDPNASADAEEGHGYVHHTTIKQNNLQTTSPLESTLEISNRVRNTMIIHPGINAQNPQGQVTGDQNSIRVSEP
ncbi:hypothetical protein GCM10008090_15640 [Arenicella chitinivorans]|uniref:Right handed beta helix domain-containing protein n=1 Tax=Arenicella chitinivorans TaxID=1329800 RepID=A0A918RRB8_9GAMM|nr:right-handed parallel beta-helix repeat-containing protein [Arenicella chitinivorans]GHA06829.1 hypothetical protein GCM10008090_15640 [Arenicella chitinivorans]